jgi:hypothetical protein
MANTLEEEQNGTEPEPDPTSSSSKKGEICRESR